MLEILYSIFYLGVLLTVIGAFVYLFLHRDKPKLQSVTDETLERPTMRRELGQSDVISSASELLQAVQQARREGRLGNNGKIVLGKPVRLNWLHRMSDFKDEDTFTPHNLRGADLTGVELDLADLRGADLTDANLNQTTFRRSLLCDLAIDENAEFFSAGGGAGGLLEGEKRTYRTILNNASCEGAVFSDVNFTRAKARGLRGKRAVFEDCILERADFSGADFRSARISRCDIAGINITDVWRLATDLPIDIRASGEILSVFAAGEALATLSSILLLGLGYGGTTVKITAAVLAAFYLALTVRRYMFWRSGKAGAPEVPTTTMLILAINSVLALMQLLGGSVLNEPWLWVALTWVASFTVYGAVRFILHGHLRLRVLIRRPLTDMAVALVLPSLYTILYMRGR